MSPTIVLGAGMAGLAAAKTLRRSGIDVRLIDKGRGVGGRLATRRIDDATFDHGAQFFTTRGATFTAAVAEAMRDSAVIEWCRGFNVTDGYPRYRGERGMTSVAKWMATGLDVALGVEIERIDSDGETITFTDRAGAIVSQARDAIVTAPIPQTLALFDRGSIALPADLDAALRATTYHATLALLVRVDGSNAMTEPGGVQLDEGPFTFVADNARKGISASGALTFHAAHDYSLRRIDDDPETVRHELLGLAAPWIGPATVVDAQLHRWRYAGPVTPLPEPTYVVEIGATRIALAGDAFAGPKVEGAFNSGVAAAEALLR